MKRKRKVRYPSFVDIKSIKSRGRLNYRFWLRIPFKNRTDSKILCVILKNPSVASNSQCDNTISRVCNVANCNGYDEVIILNLFPFRSTRAKGVVKFYNNKYFKNIMKVNLQIIKSMCKNRDVVFAWGTNTISQSKKNIAIYDNTIKYVTSNVISRTNYVKRCICSKKKCNNKHPYIRYPLHGLRWNNNSRIIKY